MGFRRIILAGISLLTVLSLSSCGVMRHYGHPEPPRHHHRHDVPPPPPHRPHHHGDRDHEGPRHHRDRDHKRPYHNGAPGHARPPYYDQMGCPVEHGRPDRRCRGKKRNDRHRRPDMRDMAASFSVPQTGNVYYWEV